MQLLPLLALLLALGAPGVASAQDSPARIDAPVPARNIRVSARIVLLDRTEASRIGLRYVQAGGGRIRVDRGRERTGSGLSVQGDVGGLPVKAFIDLARNSHLLRSESRMQVTTLSGSSASIASGAVRIGGFGAVEETGPELDVRPTLQGDGTIRLDVRARIRDEVSPVYGARADGSPVDAATTLVVRPGEDATIGTMAVSTETRDAGLLRWSSASGSRDALVVLSAEALRD